MCMCMYIYIYTYIYIYIYMHNSMAGSNLFTALHVAVLPLDRRTCSDQSL